MALQVWLPLINNVENQGVSNIPIINNGVTFVDNGKIGKCASFNNNYFSLQNLSNFNTISVSFWMKPANTNQIGCLLNYRTGIGLDIAIFLIQGKVRFDAGGQTIFNYTYTTDWQHVTVTYDGNIKSLYINGILNQSITINKAISCTATKGTVGASSVNTTSGSDNNYIGLLNDYRIYDHCLSPKEVKEISKGLVLHYPLNDAYVEETSNLFSTNLTYHRNWNNSGSAIWNWDDNTIPKINNSIIYSISRTDAGNSAIGCGACNLVAGKTYTASVYVYLSGNVDSNLFYIRSVDTHIATLKYSNDTNPQKWPQNQWIRATATFTPSAAYNSCYICSYLNNANSKRALTCWQIEEKDHATPYTPNTRNETTVYDCSGYQNNGTISGSLSCSTNSSRYKISTVFDGISSKIINDSFPASIVSGTNSFTICGWAYCIKGNSYNPLFHIGSSYRTTTGICLHGNGDRIEGLGINGTKIDNTYGSGYSNEKWVHQCIVYDGTTIKRYLNGNSTPIQSITCPGFKSDNNKLCVGGFWGVPFKGYLSDFRVYATALSEEDIKELYNTSCIINS